VENRAVTLMIRYRDSNGTWKRHPAARGGNGRVKPGYAVVNGQPVKVEGFSYDLRLYENRTPKYISVGKNAADADAQRARQELVSTARVVAEDAGLKVEADRERKTLRETARAYIKDAESRNAMEAAAQARSVTSEFIAGTKKTYVDEISREDVLKFHAVLRKRGCEDRTVANKHARLTSWLVFSGLDKTVFPPKPSYEEKLPTVYSRDQISTLLGEADPKMNLTILLALKCGLREQELMYLEYSDIDYARKTLTVRGKEKWGFKVKDKEQREIAVPDDVLLELKTKQDSHPGESLVLGTRNGQPNTKLLRALKGLAKRAGLNCGRCEGCKERRECQEFTLHRFRRTYMTTLLRSGIDLKTVQALAGHSDLASTMRYLRPAQGEELQAKVNAVQW